MFSNASDRSGPKKGKGALKLRKRQESVERQSSARGDVVEDLRTTTEEPPESQMWIDDNFQRVLKKLVHSLIDAENQLFSLQERKQKLESFKSDGKVPKGLKIIRVAAKGRNAERLQQIFDGILREAESKLLDATIEALQIEEQQLKDGWIEEKQKVVTSIEAWRSSFQSSDPSLDIEADYFYFECAAAKRTSKRVADSIQKANKAAKNTERMEAQFTVNEESINDLVHRAVQREVSKLTPVSLPAKTPQAPRKTSRSRKKERSSSANRSKRRDLSRNGNQHKPSASKTSAQGRRSRSKHRRQPTSRKPRVNFSDSRPPSVSGRQQSKNVKGRGNGVVK
ncbi:myosin-15-like [Acropora muricata]|uniref:myosin-15-like n=1 Tax=Acropora muricata TaxID=159855 RepID=UPI0034E3AB9C